MDFADIRSTKANLLEVKIEDDMYGFMAKVTMVDKTKHLNLVGTVATSRSNLLFKVPIFNVFDFATHL